MCDEPATDNHRRRFMRISLIGLTLTPIGTLLVSQNAAARGSRAVTGQSVEIPKLPESDRQALALAYNENAASIDVSKYKKTEGAACRNCQLYSGSEGEEWGPCAIFSYRLDPRLNRNYLVSARGWCRSWSARDA